MQVYGECSSNIVNKKLRFAVIFVNIRNQLKVNEKDFKRLGETIKSVREEKGLTQEQMAPLIGMGVRMLQKYENGQAVPKTKRTFDNYMDRVEKVRVGKANVSRETRTQPEPSNECYEKIIQEKDELIELKEKTIKSKDIQIEQQQNVIDAQQKVLEILQAQISIRPVTMPLKRKQTNEKKE